MILHSRPYIYKRIYEESVSFSLEMTLLISASSRTQPGPQSGQRPKNPGSGVALLPGKFLRVRKVFARITETPLKLSQHFQNDPDFSR